MSIQGGEFKVGDTKTPDLINRAQSHSWLEFKEDPRFILDVVPVYRILGLTPVVPIMLDNNVFGYLPSGDVDPAYWTPERNKKLHADVNVLGDLFQEFMDEN